MRTVHVENRQVLETRSSSETPSSMTETSMRPVSPVLRAAVVLGLLGASATTLAQVPSGGDILRGLERSIPTTPMTSPDGVRIEVPDAPALGTSSPEERLTVSRFQVTGNTVFDEETLLALIADQAGSKTMEQLYAVADQITAYYRNRGYLLAVAYLPQQEVKDGLLTIAVLEGRYDRIDVDSSARVSDERVLRTLSGPLCSHEHDCSGALISRKPLERGLLILNDTPGVQAAARLSPGEHTGTSTLGVRAVADPLAAGAVQFDNSGSYYTGVARGIGSLWLNSPLSIGDQLTLQGVATTVHGNMYYGALGYGVPLGYSGLRFNVRGSYLYYELGDRYESLDAHGTVKGADASLSYPIVRRQAANLSATVSYGERRFHDEAEAVGVDTKRRINDRTELTFNGDLRDGLFGVPALNTLSVGYTWGELELDSMLRLVDLLTTRSEGSYGKWAVEYARLQSLFGRTSLYVRASAQGTSDNLDSYEKFALGGPTAVRAYPTGETLADESTLYSVELRQGISVPWVRDLQVMAFYDRARGDLNASPWYAGGNRVTLDGAGVGLNCALTDRMMLSSTIAWRGDRPMTAAPDSSYQYYLSLNTAF